MLALDVRIFDRAVVCPAGMKLAAVGGQGPGCLCKIEGFPISAREQPSSLASYCMNKEGYRRCPTWRKEKDAIAEGRRGALDEPVEPPPRFGDVTV